MIFGAAPGAGKTILLIASLAGAGVDPPSAFTSAPIAAASVATAPMTATTIATRDDVLAGVAGRAPLPVPLARRGRPVTRESVTSTASRYQGARPHLVAELTNRMLIFAHYKTRWPHQALHCVRRAPTRLSPSLSAGPFGVDRSSMV